MYWTAFACVDEGTKLSLRGKSIVTRINGDENVKYVVKRQNVRALLGRIENKRKLKGGLSLTQDARIV